jgi:hypothetical protein
MIIRPMNATDVNYVMNNLWERGRKEANALGQQMFNIKFLYLSMIGKPWALSFFKDVQSPCAAICCMESIGEYQWRTHFIATEEGFKSTWKELTIFLRKISDSIIKDGGCVECVTDHNNKMASKWFAVMGFRLDKSDEKVDKYIKQAIGHGARKRVSYVRSPR